MKRGLGLVAGQCQIGKGYLVVKQHHLCLSELHFENGMEEGKSSFKCGEIRGKAVSSRRRGQAGLKAWPESRAILRDYQKDLVWWLRERRQQRIQEGILTLFHLRQNRG